MHAKSTYHNFGIFDGVWFYNQNVDFFVHIPHKRKRVLVHIKCPLFMRARKKVSRQPCFWVFPGGVLFSPKDALKG